MTKDKTMTRSELTRQITGLAEQAQEFRDLTNAANTLLKAEGLNAHDLLFAVDKAIDSWNVLINQAPGVLKRAKQHLDELVYGSKK